MKPFALPRFSRRHFLHVLATCSPFLALARSVAGRPVAGKVVVIGAGMAGLAAGRALADAGVEVKVLEARDYIGGRIHTDRSLGFPFDLGAAWIHGPEGNPITELATKAKGRMFVTDDESVLMYDSRGQVVDGPSMTKGERRYRDLVKRLEADAPKQTRDESVALALRRIAPEALADPLMRYFLSAYMEFDSGGSIERLSAAEWQNDEKYPGKDVLMIDGYDAVTNWLAQGLDIQTETIVASIAYDDEHVSVTDTHGETYEADAAIVTLPLGVLQSGGVTFSPGLPARKREAIARVRVGVVNKVCLVFGQPHWDVKTQYFGFQSSVMGKYNYFLNTRTFCDVNALVTFAFDSYGRTFEQQSDAQITDDVMATLRTMFGDVPAPERVLVTRWGSDAFARGAYSFASVGATRQDFESLAAPVGKRLRFAGEHTSAAYRGTVHGAYLSGLREATRIKQLLSA
ncbi:FAD-dependent oxidoreductase [Chloracidobacterium validum]|uniref:Tryptophan 2-monooxygenase n=1 Tax=Chloracidobacterium validum TaxID=2821543 RepID=A0ABX8BD07_9BACT|nr:FAD-dependent oxidoreductase [Chloracidobacterium validum]QUW02970.1 FAD-dependent oxidoreductase [Chloracidobacterium validum]